MALNGSATIELTNADGSKEVIRHDNMITNAASDFLKSYRGDIAPIMKITDNGNSYMQALFGGILLFDDTLNSDPDDYFLPSLKVTGYASQDAYAGTDVARGSYNVTESGLQEDGKSYKFVWDFSTSQGNGTIKSLGLCPNKMGELGITYVRDESAAKTYTQRTECSPFYLQMLPDTNNSLLDGDQAEYLYIAAIVDDIAYLISENNIKYLGGNVSRDKFIGQNGGKLRLFRMKLGADNIAVNNVVGLGTFLNYVDVQLPTEFTSLLHTASYAHAVGYTFDPVSKKIYVFPDDFADPNNTNNNHSVQVNETIKYCDIDLNNNYAVNVYTFTNNTAGSIFYEYAHSLIGAYNFLILNNDYILSSAEKDNQVCLYITKRSDNTQVKEVKNADGTPYSLGTERGYFVPVFRNDKIVVLDLANNNGNKYYGPPYVIIDLTTGEAREFNAERNALVNRAYISSKVLYTGNPILYIGVGENGKFAQAVNPFVLTTKNNLDSPVVKTASQTMKITYTLTESEGT